MLNYKSISDTFTSKSIIEMFKIKKIKINLTVGFVICLCLITNIFGQENSDKKREIFQNQQRALNLSLYKNNIKSLEDAPMRCFVRKQIVEFIFAKKVKEHYGTAEDFAVDCLEDIDKNPKQFTSTNFKTEMISLLRTNLPNTAKKIEVKYLTNRKESDTADLVESVTNENVEGITNRILSKIQRGEVPQNINFTVYRIKEKNPQSAILILDTLLKHYENSEITDSRSSILNTLFADYTSDLTSNEVKTRFLFHLIKMGQKALTAEQESKLLFFSRWMLKSALPQIKELIPAQFQQASAISTTLDSKISAEEKELLEILKRIEESEDKLGQTIIEAEATEFKKLQYILWERAAKIALSEKKFKIAVDCILRYEGHTEDYTKVLIDQFLTRYILSATLKEKDFESADYVVENTEDLIGKAFSLLEISSEHSKLKDEIKALEKLNEALRVLDKAENDIHKVRNMLSAARLATKIENADAFEILSLAIKVINRLPSLSPDDQLETESRNKYVSGILMPNAYNLNNTFNTLAAEDVDFAYPIAQGIQRKDLRLVAEIVIEMHKVYPYTPEKSKESSK